MAPDGTEQPVEQHPLLDLLAMPNDGYDWDTLLKGVIASYVLSGNAYIMVVRNRGGRVGQLWYIPARADRAGRWWEGDVPVSL